MGGTEMNTAQRKGLGLHWWLTAGIGAVALAVLYWFDPSRYHFYPLCLFHSITGLFCPGCGALRALHQLTRGHVAAAFHLNPLLLVWLPFFCWYAAARGLRQVRGQPNAGPLHRAWVWVFIGSTLVFGVLRNLPGEPFAMLRP